MEEVKDSLQKETTVLQGAVEEAEAMEEKDALREAPEEAVQEQQL